MTPDEIFHKAQLAHQSGNAAEAERQYRALIAQAPDHAQGQHLLALLLLEQGDAMQVESHIAQACALLTDEPYMHQNHALVLTELQRFDDAAAAAGRAIKLDPDYLESAYRRMWGIHESGNPPEIFSVEA